MKILVIGGNRFVGLRFTHALAQSKSVDLHIVNRTGQAPHASGATIYKADRLHWTHSHVDREFDVVVDFAAFTDADLVETLAYFKRIDRYIFISTVAVYDQGANLREEDFSPKDFDLTTAPLPKNYQNGKRRAEAYLTQNADFPVLSVRLPYILGPDDYSRRLEFHVQRIEQGLPLFFPNLQARTSMIHAEDACLFLERAVTNDWQGPLNVGSPDSLSMQELVQNIEARLAKKVTFAGTSTDENHSRYGRAADLVANVERATRLGFTARPLHNWLNDLIESARLKPASAKSRLH